MTIDTISTFISRGWVSLNTSGHPSLHTQLLVWRQQTHFSKFYPTSSIHAGKFQLSVSLQRPAASHHGGIDPPAALHSYSHGAKSPWPQGLFCICGASAYMHLPSRAEGKCSLGYILPGVTWANDRPQCPIKESTSRLEHGGHQRHLALPPHRHPIASPEWQGIDACERARPRLPFRGPVDCSLQAPLSMEFFR